MAKSDFNVCVLNHCAILPLRTNSPTGRTNIYVIKEIYSILIMKAYLKKAGSGRLLGGGGGMWKRAG